eukprot:gene22433-42727_t
MWLSMLLYLPLSLLFWHAPGLVHWHGVPPVKALFFSIVACVRNFGAFLVYGLGWLGVFLLGGLVVSIVSALLAVAGLAGSMAGGIMVGAAMMMAAMFFTRPMTSHHHPHQLLGRSEQELAWFQRRSLLQAAALWVASGGWAAAHAQGRSNI